VTSRAPTTLEPAAGSRSKSVVATVTGVDSADQLFRDNASVVFLKGQKCTYLSRFKPASNASVMIEFRGGSEPWRANAKVRSASPAAELDTFRVTVELERAHTLVVEAEDTPSRSSGAASRGKSAGATTDAETGGESDAPDSLEEMTAPESAPAASSTLPPAHNGGRSSATIQPAPSPTPAAKAAVTDVVRSIVATEVEQWKSKLQDEIADHVEAALRGPLESIDSKIEKRLGKQPAVTEDAVRKIAVQEAENAHAEWKSAAKLLVSEVVRSAVAAETDRQRKEVRTLVSDEIEAAVRATHLDAKVEKAVEERLAEQSRKRPALTEESARRLAAEVAESVQLEWASTKLQKMVTESVRSTLAAESGQRRTEIITLISKEVEAALGGPLAARIDAAVENTLTGQIEDYFRTSSAAQSLQERVAEAVRRVLEAEQGQRAQQLQDEVSKQIEAAVGGPIAARIDAAIEKMLAAKIESYFQTPSAIQSLQRRVAETVHESLEAEYERRGKQIQAVVASQIEAAVRGPIASQMDQMLRKALETQREEYVRNPPPITEDALRKIAANVAKHPELQRSLEALSTNLLERWTDIARSATATVQKDINSRISETERLADQVVRDIQARLNSFNSEMNRILAVQESTSSGDETSPDQPEREKRFRELLQSTGANFEREMKAALQKIFGGS
jgi:hypothetical protein